MLLAYRDDGSVVATLDYRVLYDESRPDRPALGVVDFAAHEAAGGEMTDIWHVEGTGWVAKGSKVWPEWLGAGAHDFTVELDGPPGQKRIVALVHKTSGYRRERAVVEAAIADRIAAQLVAAAEAGDLLRSLVATQEATAQLDEADRVAAIIPDPAPEPADIRDLVGGPDRPLLLDADGRTIDRSTLGPVTPQLPLVGFRAPVVEPPAAPDAPLAPAET